MGAVLCLFVLSLVATGVAYHLGYLDVYIEQAKQKINQQQHTPSTPTTLAGLPPYGHPMSMSSSVNLMMGNHGMPSQFPGSGMHLGGMHPFSPSVFSGGPMMHGGAANPMMMNRLGGGPPHFRPGMLTPQQQQQYMQQQRQMMAAAGQNPMLKGPMAGIMQQSPGQPLFPPNSHPLAMQQQMMQQQMMNKSAGLMPPPNAGSSQPFDPQNTSIFGKQQGGIGARPGEQPYNQRQQQQQQNQRGAVTNSTTNDYSVSRVDSVELNQIMSSIVGIAVSSSGLQKELNRPSKSHQPVFHPWGVQIANSVREPKESEYLAVIRELQPLLEVTMYQARIGAQSPNKKFEGPLTWRSFLKKMAKTATQPDETEGGGQVEPIPNIVVATEREPVTTNPQLVNAWEKLALAPYDQTKDVLYLAVVPDNNVVAEKCRVFLEELSNMYEKCRFGSHVKMQTKDSPRDAIIKVGHQRLNGMNPGPSTNGHNGSLQAFLNAFEEGKYLEDKKGLTSKLRGFIENYERELTQFFRANEHTLFERRAYHESIQRNNQHQHYTSLATSSDSSSMPPPAVPIQSPSSILSSASGPASGNCTAHLSVGPMAGVVQVQLSPSGQPLPGQPQQQSPNPLSNIAPGMEELTPESQQNGGTPNPHLQQQQQQQLDQANAIIEANIEKTVEEMLSLESPSYLPHVIVIYLINPFSFGSEAHHAIFARLANVALMRVFNCFLQQLDIRRRPQIQMEMLSLQSLYDYTAFAADPLREDRQSMESVENFTCRDKMSAQDCFAKNRFLSI